MFSRLVLERLDNRYVVVARETIFESEIGLTPTTEDGSIDAAALGEFIRRQYAASGIAPEAVDTGALILTGVAARRSNARAIGHIFAREAGRLVAVSAGDSLETIMSAHGAGAVARSIRDNVAVMNVDIGGGTCKIAVCVGGAVAALTALDVGARLVCFDGARRITRIEPFGRYFAEQLGLRLAVGMELNEDAARALAGCMADRLFDAMRAGTACAAGHDVLRLDPLAWRAPIGVVSFSGGVAEYIYGREAGDFGDLGPLLAAEIRARVAGWGPRVEPPAAGIRATVIGASQYTAQLSGSTIFVAPQEALPLRNVPVIVPDLALDSERLDPVSIARAVATALARHDLAGGETPVALFVSWHGSATFQRLDALCRGIVDGLAPVLAHRHPLIVAGDGDVGGLIGIHCRDELGLENPIVSIDGLELKAFDYIDIGAILRESGTVPVVIKSLIFPGPHENEYKNRAY